MPEKTPKMISRARAAIQILLGKSRADGENQPAPASSGLQSRIGHLEMDLRQRDERIAEMQKEFEHQRRQAAMQAAGAGKEQVRKLMKKVAPFLSQMDVMRHVAEGGKEVACRDLLVLLAKIEQVLIEAGLTPHGKTGAIEAFDHQIHQRMSGGDVETGIEVRVRFPGYSFDGQVLLKAMVSSKE
jgi:molecular chaperone GrpE